MVLRNAIATCVSCAKDEFPKKFSYFLKIASEVILLIITTYILAVAIVPTLQQIQQQGATVQGSKPKSITPSLGNEIVASNKSISSTPSNITLYQTSAYVYIAFYCSHVISIVVYWVIVYNSLKKKHIPYSAIAIVVLCETPLMITEMLLLQAEGGIREDHSADITLQYIYLINFFIQSFCNTITHLNKNKSRCRRVLEHIALPVVLVLVAFAVYTFVLFPVTIPNLGWGVFTSTDVDVLPELVKDSPSERYAWSVLRIISVIGLWWLCVVVVCAICVHVVRTWKY